ncbi:hypothetical protein ACEQ8H_007131 [Pleosporales sp. CAS-2024a]
MMVRLTPLRLLGAALVLTVFFFASILPALLRALVHGERGYDVFVERPPPVLATAAPTVRFGDECAPFSAGVMRDVTFVLKIGAGQAQTQLPAHLARLGRCKQDLLIFSDRKDSLHGVDIADALAHLRPEYRFNNADFDVYDRIQHGNLSAAHSPDGARLDKYKTLPMVEWTAYMRPAALWFVFVELDTYLNYDNLYRFLTHFSPRAAHYLGAPVLAKRRPAHAHGGSGFVLSRGALDKVMALGRMFGENKHFPGTHFFGQDVRSFATGDDVLAQVLKKSGVSLRGYWPMFNEEPPAGIRYSRDQWCEAIISLHRLDHAAFAALGTWEQARKHPERPLTFEELFTMAEPYMQDKVLDWSNLSHDVVYKKGSAPAKSFDQCHGACLQDGRCMQFEHNGIECRLQRSLRLGHQQPPDSEHKWTSGWMTGRIAAFKKANSPCQAPHFVHSHP